MRVTVAAIAVFLGVMGISSTSSAQAAMRKSTHMPAQDLETALQSLAKARTMQIIFRTSLVKDMRADQIEGEFTADEILTRLLNGTGLTYRYLGEDTVTIIPQSSVGGSDAAPAPSAGTALPNVGQPGRLLMAQATQASNTASAQSDSTASDTRAPELQEVVVLGKGYGERVGAKSLAPLLEVPNTITVIDQQRIREQNLFTLEELAIQTTGLSTTGSDSDLAEFVSRGFTIDNFLVDGVPNNGFTGEIPTLFLYDRVEVLRGPAGLFSGSGSPAGSINLVRKRPLQEFTLDAMAAAGSWNHYRGELDVSTPINDRAGARAGVAYQDRDQFYDVTHQKRLVAFAVFDFDLSDATRFTIGGHYDDYDGGFTSGLAGAAGGGMADFPRSTFEGVDWSRMGFDTKAGFAELRHELANDWVVRLSTQYGKLNTLFNGAYPISFTGVTPDDGTGFLLASGLTRDQQYLTADLNAVGRVSFFGRTHEVIIGTDYQRKKNHNGFYGREFLGFYDYYHPDHDIPEITIPLSDLRDLKTTQSGVYGQLRLALSDPLKLVLGGRLSRYRDSTTLILPTPAPTTAVEENGKFIPYAGLVWTSPSGVSLYASYADTFLPQEAPTAAGGNLPPIEGDQVEVGVKAALLNQRLLLTLAGYRIEQSNRAIPDINPGTFLASGRVTSKGFDIEANGEILPGWRLTGGYAYINLKDEAKPGAEVSFAVPEHSVKLWSSYQPQSGPLSKFAFSGGVNWQSETEAALLFLGGTTGAIQPSYAVVNLRLGYDVNENYSLALNVENLLDKKYYSRISGTEFGNFFGTPRSALLTVRARF